MSDRPTGLSSTVLILNEILQFVVKNVQDRSRLRFFAILEYTLDYSATVRMCREREDLLGDIAYDELDAFTRATFDALLNDVIAILILDAFDNVAFELARDLHLILGRETLDGFLNHTAAVHLQGERENIASDALGKVALVLRCAELEEFLARNKKNEGEEWKSLLEPYLNDVVAEDVGHQLRRIGKNLFEDHVLLGVRGAFELLLNESRAVLIHGELGEVSDDVA